MLWLDVSFAKQIMNRFERAKIVSINPFKINFRCPVCGDSEKVKSKRRGWIYQHNGDNYLRFGCFNCNANMSFQKFLKEQDFNLYEQYILEKYRNGVTNERQEVSEDKFKTPPRTKKFIPNIVGDLKSIFELSESHPVKKYIKERCIPEDFYNRIFYSSNFFKWTQGHTDKFKKVKEDHPRLIIPWYSQDNTLFGYSARAFGSESPKYYRIIIDDSYPSFFGMDRVDLNKEVYVVEGEIDSLFLDNCIAVGTSALYRFSIAKNIIYIPDRDVRNPQIMEVVNRLIKTGQKVCMLPEDFSKDINDAVKDGMSKTEITDLINRNSYSGLEAQLKFIQWRKT